MSAGLPPSEAVNVTVHVGGLRPGDVDRLRRWRERPLAEAVNAFGEVVGALRATS